MDLLGRVFGGPSTAALLVDGPNVLREEFSVDLSTLKKTVMPDARRTILRLYLDEHASPGLVRAAEANGFEVHVTSGDVDVKLAVDAAEFVVTERLGSLAIASRDADFKPVFELAAREGVRTIAVSPGSHGESAALSNAADECISLEPRDV